MDVLTLISIGISITSGVITTICIVIHHLIPKLKRNPGQLILVQCYLQLILDLRWVFQLKSLEKYYYENSVLCTIVSILNSLAVVMSYSYIVCLAIEVHIQIKYKMVPIHGKRVKIYHFASSFLGIFFLLFAIFTKSLGKTKVGNCSVKDFSPAAILNFGFLLICTLLLWYFVIASGLLLKDRHSKLIKRFLLILLLFTSMVSISYSLAYIEVAFSNIILIKISIIISASLGSVIGVCRLYNKMLYREIMWVLCKKKMKTHKIQKTQKNSIQVELKSTLIIDSFNKSESDPISLSEYFEIANLKVNFT